MDKKKIKEAIKVIEAIKSSYITSGYVLCESLDIAIESLGKQLPKKAKQSGVTVDGVFHPTNGIDGVPYDLCPNCEMNLCTEGIFARDKRWVKYCNNCGQKLDWSK